VSPFVTLLARDIRLASRSGGSAFLALSFFALVATLVPLGVGADLRLLARVGGGVLWVGAVLAALLSLDRLFQGDFEDGSLDLIALSPLPLELTALAKMLAHWLSTGAALTLLSPLLALLFNLTPAATLTLFLSLLLGTPAVSAVGAIGASLTLSLKRGGLILPLIILPLLSPAVIFGAGAVSLTLDRLARGEAVPGAVGTLMTNMAVEVALRGLGLDFVRAKVGDRYVLEELMARNWLIGGEGSGHLLALDKHTTGDGLISALQVLQTCVRSGRTMADLLKDVVLFPQTLINVRLQEGQDWKSNTRLQAVQAEVQAELGNTGRVLIRPSGTEPLVRVMVEAKDAAQAKRCAQRLADTLA
jgi:heme exporter protein CcmB